MEFTLDQKKILNLLTGHTLYNDTSIVLRELVQNSLDAVRFQELLAREAGAVDYVGRIDIHWDSVARTLAVVDNGTGMTLETIVSHLLIVGSSRYEDPQLRKRYPTFAPISRFGIGILSTFMIADSVEITTCSPDDESGRQLAFRSVLGKYLMRTFTKDSAEIGHVSPHGTSIKLTVRASAELPDVQAIAQRWIIVPGCEVNLTVDEGDSRRVGHPSVGAALISTLERFGVHPTLSNEASQEPAHEEVRIVENKQNNVAIAYAIRWSALFREWSFLAASQLGLQDDRSVPLCTSAQGVRVEEGTPGFRGSDLIAFCDVSVTKAPRTNVARSELEKSVERDEALKVIYSTYCNHIKNERERLQNEQRYSLTRSVTATTFVAAPLLSFRRQQQSQMEPLDSMILNEAIATIPSLVLESGENRRAIAPAELDPDQPFWTVDGTTIRFAERMMAAFHGETTLSRVLSALGADTLQLPPGPIVPNYRAAEPLHEIVHLERTIEHVIVDENRGFVALRWSKRTPETGWKEIVIQFGQPRLFIAPPDLTIDGPADIDLLFAFESVYMLRTSLLARILDDVVERSSETETEVYDTLRGFFSRLVQALRKENDIAGVSDENLDQQFRIRGLTELSGHSVDTIRGSVRCSVENAMRIVDAERRL